MSPSFFSGRVAAWLGAAVLLPAGTPAASAAGAPAPAPAAVTTATSLAVRLGYDSNVYMQGVTARANQHSAVLTLIPAGSLTWKPSGAFTLAASYAPELTRYAGASSENNVAHKLTANLSGQQGETKWELGHAFAAVAGDRLGPVFTGLGGAAIIGGMPLLERRDQHVLRQNFKAQWPLGAWFVRPVATTYFHDFRTDQRTTAGYQNYIDRNELAAGLDAGKKLAATLTLYAGVRAGSQDQGASPVSAFQYDNHFRRALAGLDATPVPWLKLALLAGADRRRFAGTVPATLDRGLTRLFLDASATATAGKTDSATFTAKRFALPGYGGGSFLEITAFDLAWKHTFSPALSATFTGRAHHWDFARPVLRNEWWHGAGVTLAAKLTAHCSLAAAVARDAVRSKLPNTPGREATRDLATLSGTFTF